LYAYRPGQRLPPWLQKIAFPGPAEWHPQNIRHGVYGLAVKVKGQYFVWLAAGNFLETDRGQRAPTESRGTVRTCISLYWCLVDIYEHLRRR
jgi:hypothetical protein